MCLAIFKPKGKSFPTNDIISNAWNNNPHGAGLAIAKKSGVEIIKGIMTFNDLVAILKSPELVKEDVVLHFRWSTSGTIIPELTHPFPVTVKNKDFRSLKFTTDKAIIHNGVLFDPLTSAYSDTAIFSRYLALKPKISEKQIKKIIGQDRLAMIHKDKIKLLGNWTMIDGLSFSNTYSIVAPRMNYLDMFDDYAYDNVKSIPAFKDEYAYNPNDEDDCEYCPFCDSDNVEFIGVKTRSYECLDCSTVYNETDMLLSTFHYHKNVTAKLKKVK